MRSFAGVAVLLLLPMAAFAQGNPGPFGGLFGRTPERVGKEYRLFEVRTATTGQYQQALNDGSISLEDARSSSALGAASVSATFAQRSSRLEARIRTNATQLQYFQSPYNGGTAVDTSGSLTFRVATRLVLNGSVSHVYSPYFQYHPQAFSWTADGVLVPPLNPYVATVIETNSYHAGGGVSIPYSKRSSLAASFHRSETRFLKHREFDQTMSAVRGNWSRQLNRDFRLKFGYGRDQARARAGGEYVFETFDAGVDFTRTSIRHRLSLSMNTQPSMVTTPQYGRQYRLNGALMLTRGFQRTWQVGVNLHRNTDFVPGFADPLLSDTFGLRLSGLMSRSVELVLQADAGRGQLSFHSGAATFAMASSRAQFNVALARRVGVFFQHALFYYDLPRSASSVAPVTSLASQTVTIGLTTWIPVYTRERSPSDTR